MMNLIYAMPLWLVGMVMVGLVIGWGRLAARWRMEGSVRRWKAVNAALLCAGLLLLGYHTVFSRTVGDREVVLKPLAFLAAAQEQPELYRSMVMNVFLFFPLGLTLSQLWPDGLPTVGNVLLTLLCAGAVSAGIEYCQYRFGLGRAEIDDILCNTLGAGIGTIPLVLQGKQKKNSG